MPGFFLSIFIQFLLDILNLLGQLCSLVEFCIWQHCVDFFLSGLKIFLFLGLQERSRIWCIYGCRCLKSCCFFFFYVFGSLIPQNFEKIFRAIDDVVGRKVIAEIFHKQILDVFVVVEDTSQIRAVLKFLTPWNLQFLEDDSEVITILEIRSILERFIQLQGVDPSLRLWVQHRHSSLRLLIYCKYRSVTIIFSFNNQTIHTYSGWPKA